MQDEKSGNTEEYPADYVVLAMGVHPENPLEEACKNLCGHVSVIGDAKQVGRIETAVRAGFEAAYELK